MKGNETEHAILFGPQKSASPDFTCSPPPHGAETSQLNTSAVKETKSEHIAPSSKTQKSPSSDLTCASPPHDVNRSQLNAGAVKKGSKTEHATPSSKSKKSPSPDLTSKSPPHASSELMTPRIMSALTPRPNLKHKEKKWKLSNFLKSPEDCEHYSSDSDVLSHAHSDDSCKKSKSSDRSTISSGSRLEIKGQSGSSSDTDELSAELSAEESGQSTDSDDSHLKPKPKTLRLATRLYRNFQFKIKITEKEWLKCWKIEGSGKKKKLRALKLEKWRELLRDHFNRLDKDKCNLQYKTAVVFKERKKRGKTMDAYCYCKGGHCKWFKFKVDLKQGTCPPSIKVFSDGLKTHPVDRQTTGHLKGRKRKAARQELKTKMPATYQLEQIEKLSYSDYEEGNLRTVKSDAVVSNVRSEALADGDRHKDDVIDVLLEMRAEKEDPQLDEKDVFIQDVSDPLKVFLFSLNQISTILGFFRFWRRTFVSVDATGGLVRKPRHEQTRILSYSASVNCDGSIAPLFEMISSRHDQAAIGRILAQFKQVCTRQLKKRWPCVGKVTTDMSMAIMLAIMTNWNQTSLTDYLRIAYKHVLNKCTTQDMDRLVYVFLCRNHIMGLVSQNCKSHSIGKPKNWIILEGMASLIECKSMDEFDLKCTAFLVLLLSKKKSELTKNAAEQLMIGSRGEDVLFPDVTLLEEEFDEHQFQYKEKMSETPFVKHFQRLVQSVKETLSTQETSSIDSQAYCPEFIPIFEETYAPVICCWTDIMSGDRGDVTSRVSSNADVEDLFKEKKFSTHKLKHNKVGRYVRVERQHVKRVLKKIKMGLITSSKAYRKKMAKEDIIKNLKSRKITHPAASNVEDDEPAKVSKKIKISSAKEGIGKTLQSKKRSRLPSSNNEDEDFKVSKKIKVFPEKNEQDINLNISDLTREKDKHHIQTLEGSSSVDISRLRDVEETWGHSRKKRKHSYFEKRKTDLLRQGKEIPCPKKRKSKSVKIKKAAGKENEHQEEKWNSPPAEKKVAIRPAARGRSLSLGKKITGSVLREPDSSELEVGPVINAREDIARTHYAQYSLAPKIPLVDRKFLIDLNFDEQVFVEEYTENNVNDVLLTFDDDRPLYFSAFSELLRNGPLSSVTMDACLANIKCRFGQSSIFIGSFTDGKQIFQETFSEQMSVNKVNITQFTKLLLPIHTPKHWLLAIVDLPQRLFCIVDPAGTDKEDEIRLCEAFQSYICHRSKTRDSESSPSLIFKVATKTPTWQLQGDDYDCGLLVLHFVESVLRLGKFVAFDPYEYRVEVAKRLIQFAKENINASLSTAPERQELGCYTFNNGLITDMEYYNPSLLVTDSWTDFTVCNYGRNLNLIRKEDFQKLLEGGWLSNSVIDSAIHSYMDIQRRNSYLNIRCIDSYDLFTGRVNETHVLSSVEFSNRTLLMPITLSGVHWCLVIANFRDKTYQYLDPLRPQQSAENNMIKFLSAVNARNKVCPEKIDTSGWTTAKVPQLPEQSQDDADNCGVYVILYALLHMSAITSSEFVDPYSFRSFIAQKILQECPNMRHLCLKCGSDEYKLHGNESIGTMIQCKACLRWLHERCCRLKDFNAEKEFTCIICIKFLSAKRSRT